jgi:hypothetical protein
VGTEINSYQKNTLALRGSQGEKQGENAFRKRVYFQIQIKDSPLGCGILGENPQNNISGQEVLFCWMPPQCLPERPLIRPRIDGTHPKGFEISNDT